MTLTKIVNGVSVPMAPAEEAATLAEWAADTAASAAAAAQAAALAYRDERAVAYRDALGAETGDFVKTIGDVLDAMIAEMRARGAAATPAFAAMVAKIDAIKAQFPKPAPAPITI